MGAEAVQKLLTEIDLDEEIRVIREQVPETNSETKTQKTLQEVEVTRGI
jgi:DNA-directed RNA polymerase subunit beta'